MIQKIINEIIGDFDLKNIKETFSIYELEFQHNNIDLFSKKITLENYNKLNDSLSYYGYKWDLSVDDFTYSINQECFKILTVEPYDDVEDILIRLSIYKTKNQVCIINNDAFNAHLRSLNTTSLLQSINVLDDNFTFYNSEDDFEIESNKKNGIIISNQCYFRNISSFNYAPDTFYFENIYSTSRSLLDDYFLKLAQIYCYIYIFNTSEIVDDDLHLTITGHITIKYKLPLKEITTTSLKQYYTIYAWIYSEKNKAEDKLALSRNILTSYINPASLEIDSSVFTSILSSNKIYIKGNINKYFEVRNKIIDQIENTIEGVNKSIESFLGNFQKSTFIFISYFLSVFIFKVINKSPTEKIFTKETSIIGVAFMLISFLYLIASLLIVQMDKRRLKKRYNNVKKRYHDVLVPEDINKILNSDSEYKSEIVQLNKRLIIYSIIWSLTIIIFICALFYTSDFLNFKFSKN